jgi:hypothetical protein
MIGYHGSCSGSPIILYYLYSGLVFEMIDRVMSALLHMICLSIMLLLLECFLIILESTYTCFMTI